MATAKHNIITIRSIILDAIMSAYQPNEKQEFGLFLHGPDSSLNRSRSVSDHSGNTRTEVSAR